MIEVLLQWIQAGTTPLLAILIWIVWGVKTNDLVHIYERLSNIEGKIDQQDMRERRRVR